MTSKIRVMVVDDSAVVRGMCERALSSDAAIEVVSLANNGAVALSLLEKTQIDVVVLDIEMPVMDGITALPKLLKAQPSVRVIMSSTLTTRNAEISLRALELGATDYIAKPSGQELGAREDFFRTLVMKVKALAPRSFGGATARVAGSVGLAPLAPPVRPVRQCPEPPMLLRALAIASSTGGPQALLAIFREFKGMKPKLPIFITQHMPPNFTTILAEHISKASGLDCHEAKDGEPVVNGKIYLAPGDYHMTVKLVNGLPSLALDQNPQENFCRPSADPMLRSLKAVYGEKLLVAVLTGLGADGSRGASEVVQAGGVVIAQDEASCVVYGMPRAVVEAKLASAILPLNAIAPYLLRAAL